MSVWNNEKKLNTEDLYYNYNGKREPEKESDHFPASKRRMLESESNATRTEWASIMYCNAMPFFISYIFLSLQCSYLAFCGPTLLTSKDEEAVIFADGIFPDSIPSGITHSFSSSASFFTGADSLCWLLWSWSWSCMTAAVSLYMSRSRLSEDRDMDAEIDVDVDALPLALLLPTPLLLWLWFVFVLEELRKIDAVHSSCNVPFSEKANQNFLH